MKTEATGERSNLRSASPHRNAYRTEFQALKSTFDKPKPAGEDKPKDDNDVPQTQQTRGRRYGSNVNRIKNLFMQMGMEPSENNGVPTRKVRATPSSPPRRSKPKEFSEKREVPDVKLKTPVSERISRFDTVDGPSYSKFTETRKLFEHSTQSSRMSSGGNSTKDRRGSSELLDEGRGSKSNRGSSDSLDSLSSRTEALSPTVSQLSAVFENSDSPSPNTLEKNENNEGYSVTGHYPLNIAPTSVEGYGQNKDSNSWSPSPETDADTQVENTHQRNAAVPREDGHVSPKEGKREKSVGCSTSNDNILGKNNLTDGADSMRHIAKKPEHITQHNNLSEDSVNAFDRTKSGESPTPMENNDNYSPNRNNGAPTSLDVGTSMTGDSNCLSTIQSYEHSDYNVYRVRSRFSADWEETEAGDDDDSDENKSYEPDMEFYEIPGLPAEEEAPTQRKIKFSKAPIKVRRFTC
uniref:Neurabin-1 n=1 Tax=Engystomops pustulosus TaxID=76066 RepID=A0AAV6Z3I5_ENGPU|nr:hypothetical protein GDO81_019203 [Engystomops pustulosus]